MYLFGPSPNKTRVLLLQGSNEVTELDSSPDDGFETGEEERIFVPSSSRQGQGGVGQDR